MRNLKDEIKQVDEAIKVLETYPDIQIYIALLNQKDELLQELKIQEKIVKIGDYITTYCGSSRLYKGEVKDIIPAFTEVSDEVFCKFYGVKNPPTTAERKIPYDRILLSSGMIIPLNPNVFYWEVAV